jgi:hypothetical protein
MFKVPVAAGLAAMMSLAAADTLPMYEAAYKVGKSRIGLEFRMARDACRARAAGADTTCIRIAQADRRAAIGRLQDDTGYPVKR